MSMIYGLFAAEASVDESGEVVYDRSVGDEYFAELFSALAQNGVAGSSFEVTADGTSMTVSVSSGRALIEGHFCYDKAPAVLPVSAASVARTDLVVLRLDEEQRMISLVLSEGTAAPLRSENVYELAIARIDIPAGASAITQSLITDLRADLEFCGYAGSRVSVDAALSLLSSNAVQNSTVTAALNGKQNIAKNITLSSGGSYTLADNTEYRGSDISALTLLFPSGAFHAWLRFSTGSSAPSISLPSTAKYIGRKPTFGASQTWELSIKDGVVIAQEVS